MNNLRVSDLGLLEIAESEGIVPAPYLDSVGVLTYGIGHTASAGYPDPAKMQRGMPDDLDGAIDRAIEIFRRDVKVFEERVNKHVKVALAQHEFDALVHFDFNCGGVYYRNKAGQMVHARLIEAINAHDPNASEHFYGWLKPPEIRKRRDREKDLFDTGNYNSNGDRISIWKVDEHGNLRGRLKTISGSELLVRMGRRKLVTGRAPIAKEPVRTRFARLWHNLAGMR